MGKIQIITCCNDCKYFDYQEWGYNQICEKLKRKIWKYKKDSRMGDLEIFIIPKDCPLKDIKEYEIIKKERK